MIVKTTREIIDWRFENCSPKESTKRIYFTDWVQTKELLEYLEFIENSIKSNTSKKYLLGKIQYLINSLCKGQKLNGGCNQNAKEKTK